MPTSSLDGEPDGAGSGRCHMQARPGRCEGRAGGWELGAGGGVWALGSHTRPLGLVPSAMGCPLPVCTPPSHPWLTAGWTVGRSGEDPRAVS